MKKSMSRTARRTQSLMPFVLCVAAALLAAVAGGCARSAPLLQPPRLVLAGGGVSDENVEVLDAMAGHLKPGDSAVIIPFASGEPAESAADAQAWFQSRSPGVTFEVMPDPFADANVLKACVAMVDRCSMIYFTGGDQSRITQRLLPPGPGVAIADAIKRANARRVLLCGTSAGTAVMGATMFTGGGSESALADLPVTDGEAHATDAESPTRGLRLAPGVDLLGRGDVIMDSHVFRRGRYGRMVAAMKTSNAKFAVGVADNRAVSIRGGTLRAIGEHAVLVVDGRELTSTDEGVRGVRVTILSNGDTFDLDAPLATAAAFSPSKCAEHGHSESNGDASVREQANAPSPAEAWDDDGLIWLSKKLRADRAATHTLQSERFEVRVLADQNTLFPGAGSSARVVNALLEIAPRKSP